MIVDINKEHLDFEVPHSKKGGWGVGRGGGGAQTFILNAQKFTLETLKTKTKCKVSLIIMGILFM